MRTLIHLSDIHFGRIDYATIPPLLSSIRSLAPDAVALSGDLTQRATTRQFVEARKFLYQLPAPRIVVPGNHDIPLYNVLNRFLAPLGKYRTFINHDLEPFYNDNEMAIMGINTARSSTFKGGRINQQQLDRIKARFCSIADPRTVKVLVTHHPFDLPDNLSGEALVGRAELAMNALASCGIDLLLAGHYHISETGSTSCRYPMPSYSALVIHAGTATSTRGRGEMNSFNVIRIDWPLISVERWSWCQHASSFQQSLKETFEKTDGGWGRKTIAE
jgi:3',5'-cyclic AMP phosphodiesterase CpdA